MADTTLRQKRKAIFIEVFLLLVLSLLPLFWLKPGEVVIGHDSGFRLNFLSYYKSLLYAWTPVFNFGADWQLYKGFLMTQLPEFLVTVFTGSWIIGQRFIMVYWFFAIQLSMYLLVRTIRPEKEHWPLRLGASMFYAFNFYILQAWFIVERAKFSLYAALPLSALLLYLVFEKKKPVLRYAALFGLLYFIAAGGGSPPLYGASLVAWIVTIIFFSLRRFKEQKMRGLLFSIYVAVAFGSAFLFMNAYWIVPQMGLYLSTYNAAVTERGGIEGLISWERTTSANSSLINLLRLQGVPDWYDNPYHPFAAAFLRNPVLTVASFIPALAIFIGLIVSFVKKVKHNPVVYLAFIFLTIGLLLGGGSHPPFGYFYEYAMRHVPGFAIFRSSFYKFGPLIWFSIIFLSMYFVDMFLARMRKPGIRILAGACLIAGILAYHYPFFTANFFQFDKQFSTRVQIPAYVEEMAAYANTNTDPNARIMVLPELTESFFNVQIDTYTWKFLSLDIFPRNAIDRSIIANDNNAPDDIFRLYTEFTEGTPESFRTLARYAGIRYLLWRDDAIYSKTVPIGRTIAAQRNKLASFGLTPIFQAGAWELYDLGPELPLPIVWAPQEIIVTKHAIEHPQDLLLAAGGTDPVVIEGTALPEQVIEAACLYCELDVYGRMVRETPQPALRFKPGSLLFSRLLKTDARAITDAGTNPEALFNAHISHSQLQLALLASEDKPKGYRKDAVIEDIKQSFTTAKNQLEALLGRQKNVYTIRLLLYTDVSRKFAPEVLDAFFSSLREELVPQVWMTENPTDIKYEVETATDGIYRIIVTNTISAPASIEIDGISYVNYQSIPIRSGYHKLRIINASPREGFAPQVFLEIVGVTRITAPAITFTKINPTKYTVAVRDAREPFILIFNEAFDSRWKLTLASESRQVSEENHGKANGAVNAWHIDKPGDYMMSITYQPQQLFIVGAIITGVSLLAGVCVIIKRL